MNTSFAHADCRVPPFTLIIAVLVGLWRVFLLTYRTVRVFLCTFSFLSNSTRVSIYACAPTGSLICIDWSLHRPPFPRAPCLTRRKAWPGPLQSRCTSALSVALVLIFVSFLLDFDARSSWPYFPLCLLHCSRIYVLLLFCRVWAILFFFLRVTFSSHHSLY